MPIATEPNKRYPVILTADHDKERPPTFWARALSCREWMEVEPIAESAEHAEDLRGHLKALLQALFIVLCGWDNVTDRNGQALPFEERFFPDALDPFEARELLFACMEAQRLGHEDAKKSGLPSASATANSVPETKAPEPAETAPAQPSRS